LQLATSTPPRSKRISSNQDELEHLIPDRRICRLDCSRRRRRVEQNSWNDPSKLGFFTSRRNQHKPGWISTPVQSSGEGKGRGRRRTVGENTFETGVLQWEVPGEVYGGEEFGAGRKQAWSRRLRVVVASPPWPSRLVDSSRSGEAKWKTVGRGYGLGHLARCLSCFVGFVCWVCLCLLSRLRNS
jgi:hypothetical protein